MKSITRIEQHACITRHFHYAIVVGLCAALGLLLGSTAVFLFFAKAHAEDSAVEVRQELAVRLAENINISVPSRVNYVAKADGTLISPSSDALYLKNNSGYEVRVSSVKMTPTTDWKFVSDATNTDELNAASISISPMARAANASENNAENLEVVSDEENAAIEAAKEFSADNSQTIHSLDGAEPLWTMTTAAADTSLQTENADASELHFEINGAVSQTTSQNRANAVIGSTRWYVVSDTVTDKFKTDIESLQARVTQLETDVSNLQSANSNLTNRLNTLDGANGTISSLDTRVSAAEEKLANSTSTLKNAEDRISSLETSTALTPISIGIYGGVGNDGRWSSADVKAYSYNGKFIIGRVTAVARVTVGKNLSLLNIPRAYCPSMGFSCPAYIISSDNTTVTETHLLLTRREPYYANTQAEIPAGATVTATLFWEYA